MTHYFDAVHRLARSGEVLGDTGETVVPTTVGRVTSS